MGDVEAEAEDESIVVHHVYRIVSWILDHIRLAWCVKDANNVYKIK